MIERERQRRIAGAGRRSGRMEDELPQIVIADHGPGISAPDLPHIFEPFYRGQEVYGSTNSGAVSGWPVAFLGFFVAAPLTLLAVIVIQFRRQSRALPYGPWLAIAFFLCSMFQDCILNYLGIRGVLTGEVS